MSVRIGMTSSFTVLAPARKGKYRPLTDEELTEQGDRIMEALLALEDSECGVCDGAVATDSTRSVVEISLTAEGDDYDAAERRADASMRTAIHTIGGSTPGWEFATTEKRSELVPA